MSAGKRRPAAIATWSFGASAVEAAGKVLSNGGSALDAVERGINVVELDPEVNSVGLGGRPNSDGVVELDAAIMDGATHRAGSVAALRDIPTAISVARKVMEESDHVMLVGEGALRFALGRGFERQELLTPESKRAWEQCKAEPGHDTVGLVALDAAGHVAAGCSTSGLAWKLPGRVGDSPIIGSGLYADAEIGGAAATGIGEHIMKFCASFLVVELMRGGAPPAEACRRVIGRITNALPACDSQTIALIALSKEGDFGAAATRAKPFPYAVWTTDGLTMHEVKRA